MSQALSTYQLPPIDALIEGWLFEKQNSKSGSKKTDTAYRETIQSFRETLQRGGLDLDASDHHTIADVATIWAGLRAPTAQQSAEVSPATYNQRLAIVSSFYSYYQEHASRVGLDVVNPMKSVKRRRVQAYASAMPLDGDEITARLASIERRTPQGKRDYALLMVALVTGRRASELVALRWKHIKIAGKKVILTFDQCKGGKVMRDALDIDASKVLMDYVHTVYGAKMGHLEPDAPIWVSFSRQNRGQAISFHALKDICETYLETGKVHALRHTFAVEMEKAGAPISEISARLGHTDEKITGRYLKQVRSAENPYAGKLASRFGISKQ